MRAGVHSGAVTRWLRLAPRRTLWPRVAHALHPPAARSAPGPLSIRQLLCSLFHSRRPFKRALFFQTDERDRTHVKRNTRFSAGDFQSCNKKFQSWLCATGISNKIARFDVWLGSQCAYFLRFADVPFFVKWHGIKYNNLVMICLRYSRIPKVNAKYKKAIFLYANLQYCQFSFKFLNVNCVHVAWNQCHCTLFWLEASTNQRNAWLTIDDWWPHVQIYFPIKYKISCS
jgi:hypothetical protein